MALLVSQLVASSSFIVQQPALQHMTSAPLVKLRGGSIDMSGIASAYSAALAARPVLTQSATSAVTFALSDASAQAIAPPPEGPDIARTLTTALIGFFYFGPVLHYYLKWLTGLLPGTDLRSTLLKTLVGQLGFGPAVTCVFFGAFLVKDNGLFSGLARLPNKIRQDLFVTWTSELCFWPIVDLICYSSVPVRWIPLGYNIANFFWTIFLSLQAARAVTPPPDAEVGETERMIGDV
jgi:protein Mpv17